MTAAAWAQLLVLIALLAISTPLLGSYMAKVYGGGRAPGDRVFGPFERLIYRATGVDEKSEQRWQTYAISLLAFSFVSVVVLYAQIRLQGHLPGQPRRVHRAEADVVVQHGGQLPHEHQLAELLR